MPTKCCWVIHGSLTSKRKASTSPSSFINHSTLLLNRALKRQAPCLYMHFEVRALDRLALRVRTRRRVGSTRRRSNHMHDHSRFQRDINDVTGVSLSLSLSLWLSQKSLTHNIGSASYNIPNCCCSVCWCEVCICQCFSYRRFFASPDASSLIWTQVERFGRFFPSAISMRLLRLEPPKSKSKAGHSYS